jgi:hypothetical protein
MPSRLSAAAWSVDPFAFDRVTTNLERVDEQAVTDRPGNRIAGGVGGNAGDETSA